MTDTTDSVYIMQDVNTYILAEPNTYLLSTIPVPDSWRLDNPITTLSRPTKPRQVSRTSGGRILRRSS